MTSGSAFRWLAPRGVAGGPLLALLFFSTVAAGDSYEALGLLRPPRNTPAREFALPGPGGSTVRFGTFKGKVVFLNFWATWCPPCREEMPGMEQLYQRYKSRGFTILAVSVDGEGEKVVKPFLREYRLTFPVVYDTRMKVADLYQVRALPSTYLIGRDGQIAALALGPRLWNGPEAHALIESVLK